MTNYPLPDDWGALPNQGAQHPPQDAPDVAALVARLRELAESADDENGSHEAVRYVNLIHKLGDGCDEAAAALGTLQARVAELERERDAHVQLSEDLKMALNPTPGHVNYVEWAKECRKAEAECAKLRELLREYFAALDGSHDPQAVGSTCSLIRAEAECRAALKGEA